MKANKRIRDARRRSKYRLIKGVYGVTTFPTADNKVKITIREKEVGKQ